MLFSSTHLQLTGLILIRRMYSASTKNAEALGWKICTYLDERSCSDPQWRNRVALLSALLDFGGYLASIEGRKPCSPSEFGESLCRYLQGFNNIFG